MQYSDVQCRCCARLYKHSAKLQLRTGHNYPVSDRPVLGACPDDLASAPRARREGPDDRASGTGSAGSGGRTVGGGSKGRADGGGGGGRPGKLEWSGGLSGSTDCRTAPDSGTFGG